MSFKKLILTRSKFVFSLQSERKISLTALKCKQAVASQTKVNLSWARAVEDAINFVNYESPFKKLSYTSADKNPNWFKYLEKLEQSGHPMRDGIKMLTEEGENTNQIWSIIILLVSKLASYSTTDQWNKDDFEIDTGILKSQRILADITEFAATAIEFHRDGVLNMQHLVNSGTSLDNDSRLIFGNKMAILVGDMLLGYSFFLMATLRCSEITGLMASSKRDTIEFNFLGEFDVQNNPLPFDPIKKLDVQKQDPKVFEEVSTNEMDSMLPLKKHDIMGTAKNEWKLRHILAGGSRLSRSCQIILILGKHNKEKQKVAYFMGKHMYLSYRASKDLSIFRSTEIPSNEKFSLISAPLLFHLEEDPSLYKEIRKGLESIENIDFVKVHEIVRSGPGMEKARNLLNENMSIALNLLYKFPKSESRNAIENLIFALVN